MREIEELFADSGEPVRITRGTALKVGGLGLAGAVAALLPGRASSAVRKQSVVNTCSSIPSTTCGQGPVTCNSNPACSCLTVFHKLQKVGATTTQCAQGHAGSFACGSLTPCPQGTECGAGFFCATPQSTCCSRAVCVPACGYCPSGGTCNTGFSGCGTGINCDGLGNSCFCFTTAEGGAGCGQNVFCGDVPTCQSSSDCPSTSFCSPFNGCTGCGNANGVCIPYCGTCNLGPAPPKSTPRTRSGRTAAMVSH
jgi:hypothetical protein